MQLKIFACPTGKYHSAYSPHALIELNLALTQYILAQHVQKFKILSFYPGYDAMSEKTISRYCPFKGLKQVYVSPTWREV
jgi:hypothetical protein